MGAHTIQVREVLAQITFLLRKKYKKNLGKGEFGLGFSRWRIQELKEFLEKVLILCYSASHFRKGSKLYQTLKLSCFQATSADAFEKSPV